ncbi:MAG: class I SAM-dependent methyltransferase [Vicinamibacterales bacterium]
MFRFDAPPEGETRFPLSGHAYRRDVLRCEACGHFISVHDMDLAALYGGDYVDATYGPAGLAAAFDRIVHLPPDRSDNEGRARRLLEFTGRTFPPARAAAPTVLDVGSGLCVFLHRMKAAGWRGTALDPDPRAVAHARDRVGVQAVCADFMTSASPGRFDVVTFNKVLEHVESPAAMLARSRDCLAPGGFVYVELPDGEGAAAEGFGREEFFIEHHHIFSPASLAWLARSAGFAVIDQTRLREPSSKFTLVAFLRPSDLP